MASNDTQCDDDSEIDSELGQSGPSALSSSIQTLKRRAIAAADSRERLPRQLFWSLFHTELGILRGRREQKREELRHLLSGGSSMDDS